MTIRRPIGIIALLGNAFVTGGTATEKVHYAPPAASAALVSGIAFDAGTQVGAKFRARFAECESKNTCDGKPLKFGCKTDPNNNHVLERLRDGVIFYDAKLAVDADGSPLSMSHPGKTDQAQTSFRYSLPGKPSVNADAVPYIAVPGGGFREETGITLGDAAAVIYKDHIEFALVGDVGPPCKIGEGSISLHERLGHHVCLARNAKQECTKLGGSGIERDVLFFVFVGSSAEMTPGLNDGNINDRLMVIGKKHFDRLKAR